MELLGHNFAKSSTIIDGYEDFICMKCGLHIWKSRLSIDMYFNWVNNFVLDITCDEVMIKKLLE